MIKVCVSFARLISAGDNLARSVASPGFSKSTLNVTVSFLVKVTETGLPLTGTPFRVRFKVRVCGVLLKFLIDTCTFLV